MLFCCRHPALPSRALLGLTFGGPRPIRSYECPRGLETLTPAERDRAILGNIFADFSYEVAALVADGAATFMAMEQPRTLVRWRLVHMRGFGPPPCGNGHS